MYSNFVLNLRQTCSFRQNTWYIFLNAWLRITAPEVYSAYKSYVFKDLYNDTVISRFATTSVRHLVKSKIVKKENSNQSYAIQLCFWHVTGLLWCYSSTIGRQNKPSYSILLPSFHPVVIIEFPTYQCSNVVHLVVIIEFPTYQCSNVVHPVVIIEFPTYQCSNVVHPVVVSS